MRKVSKAEEKKRKAKEKKEKREEKNKEKRARSIERAAQNIERASSYREREIIRQMNKMEFQISNYLLDTKYQKLKLQNDQLVIELTIEARRLE